MIVIRRPNKRQALRTVGDIMVVVGLFLLGFYCLARTESLVASQMAMHNFMRRIRPSARSGRNDFQLEASAMAQFRAQDRSNGGVVPKVAPFAILRIRRLNLQVPVFDGTDEITLNHGAGRIRAPGREENMVIAGHRDSFFRDLKDVHLGDTIELLTVNSITTYLIDKIRVTQPDDPSVFAPTQTMTVTLITCYPFHFIGAAPKRYIVSASLAPMGKEIVRNR